MRKRIIGAVAAVPLVLGGAAGPVAAEVNAVTPSTNDANKAAGWAYFDAVAAEDSVALTFTTTRAFESCFEYRADDAAPTQTTANPNTLVTDGLWDFVCVNASGVASQSVTVPAAEHVDVRLVFGGETDERFDWTRVDTLEPVDSTEPTEPTRPATVKECKQGGWADLGYKNQGRCVSDVRTYDNQQKKAAKAEQKAAKKGAKADAKSAKVTAKGAKKTAKKAAK